MSNQRPPQYLGNNGAYELAQQQLSVRDTAQHIFRASFDKNGNLDLEALKTNIKDVAELWPTFDEHYASSDVAWRNKRFTGMRDALNQEVRGMVMNIAKPGIVSQTLQQWGLTDAPDVTCNVPANFNPKNLEQSMRDAGVKCHKR